MSWRRRNAGGGDRGAADLESVLGRYFEEQEITKAVFLMSGRKRKGSGFAGVVQEVVSHRWGIVVAFGSENHSGL